MTDAEKLAALKIEYGSSDTDDVLNRYLKKAERIVVDKLYPLGEPLNFALSDKYAEIQIEIAVYLLNKRGAEGEVVHNENGVNRSYESAFVPMSLLNRIIPYGKVF